MEAKEKILIRVEPIPMERALEEAYKAGRGEVVEHIGGMPIFIYSRALDTTVPIKDSPEWQAKLKEWGIDEPI